MTSIVDTFDRADNASSMGTTSDGNATWAPVGGTWGILSNQAYLASGAGQITLVDAGVADGDVKVTAATTSSGNVGGLIFRYTDVSNNWRLFYQTGTGNSFLQKRVAGTNTNVGSAFTVTAGQVVEAVLSGSSITIKVAGTTVVTTTDSFNSTATKFGLYADNSAIKFDDFSVAAAANVALTAAVTQENTLAGTLSTITTAAVSAAVTQENLLAGHLRVVQPFSASMPLEHVLSATLTVSQPLAAWSSNDIERTDLPFELWGLLEVDPAEVAPPAGVDYIQVEQALLVMPTPTLTNGLPDPTAWQPSSLTYSRWATTLQLVISGVDRSWIRNRQFVPVSDACVEPFGDAEALIALPGVTEFEDPAAFGLTALAPVSLRRKDEAGIWHSIYEGDVASFESYQLPGGPCLAIACVGWFFRLDLLKQPPSLLVEAVDLGRMIPKAVNDKRKQFYVNVGAMAEQDTGIKAIGDAGSFKPFVTGWIQDYLATAAIDNGSQWTIGQKRPRTPVLFQKNMTDVWATISYGAPGVDVKLSKDFTAATTAVYGTGTNGHDSWMGARFPNLTQGSVPAFPLAVGAVFNPGDGQTGFAPFAAYLRHGHYGQIESDDTYLASDENSVTQFQDRAGITVDGIVGAQTWEAAFQPGANQGSMAGAYVGTIYELSATRQRKFNAQGADVGPNPHFDPTVPRIEDYVPFGDNVPKTTGVASAKEIIDRNHPAGWTGTITLTSDADLSSRFNIDPGRNIQLNNFHGGSVVLHVTRRDRDWRTGTVTLTVDEKARDEITRAMIHQREKDIGDLVRRRTHGRKRSTTFNDYGTWLTEDGAGHIPLMNQQGGFWNVQRIAAARRGSIERISLALGTGLTQHLLNRNLSTTPAASIPGAARGCIAIFANPITANNLDGLPGLATPLTYTALGLNPWDVNNDELVNYFGLIYAAGGPGNAIGFYPNNDPGDGTSTNLTGRFEDGASVAFGPNNYYWLWVAIWCPTSCIVGGRIFPGAPG